MQSEPAGVVGSHCYSVAAESTLFSQDQLECSAKADAECAMRNTWASLIWRPLYLLPNTQIHSIHVTYSDLQHILLILIIIQRE